MPFRFVVSSKFSFGVLSRHPIYLRSLLRRSLVRRLGWDFIYRLTFSSVGSSLNFARPFFGYVILKSILQGLSLGKDKNSVGPDGIPHNHGRPFLTFLQRHVSVLGLQSWTSACLCFVDLFSFQLHLRSLLPRSLTRHPLLVDPLRHWQQRLGPKEPCRHFWLLYIGLLLFEHHLQLEGPYLSHVHIGKAPRNATDFCNVEAYPAFTDSQLDDDRSST